MTRCARPQCPYPPHRLGFCSYDWQRLGTWHHQRLAAKEADAVSLAVRALQASSRRALFAGVSPTAYLAKFSVKGFWTQWLIREGLLEDWDSREPTEDERDALDDASRAAWDAMPAPVVVK